MPPGQLIGLPPLQRSSNVVRSAESGGSSMPVTRLWEIRPRKCFVPQSFVKARLILIGPSRRRSSGALDRMKLSKPVGMIPSLPLVTITWGLSGHENGATPSRHHSSINNSMPFFKILYIAEYPCFWHVSGSREMQGRLFFT